MKRGSNSKTAFDKKQKKTKQKNNRRSINSYEINEITAILSC